jgi:hypothetical protein
MYWLCPSNTQQCLSPILPRHAIASGYAISACVRDNCRAVGALFCHNDSRRDPQAPADWIVHGPSRIRAGFGKSGCLVVLAESLAVPCPL